MNIAINTRLLLKNKMEGIGWFTYETMKRITQQHQQDHFYFIFDRPFDKDFVFADNITPIVIGPQSRHPVLWYIWFNWSLYKVLRSIKPDVFVSPEGYICLNSKVKTINVMHDIAYEHYPETVPWLVKRYYKYFFPRFAKRANRIATVSQFSKNDIVSQYHIPQEKIDIVYNGCNELYRPIDETSKKQTRKKYSGETLYFVYVGSINPRKNIIKLLQAFDKFKSNITTDYKLLLIGKQGFGMDAVNEVYHQLQHKMDIEFMGRVEDNEELNKIISSSVAMVYVSVFEGFGIPCLEAMRCGTAVIASNTSSLPEVCGDAAIYVDPFDVDAIAEAMRKMAFDQELRQDLISKGNIQAQKFSWQKTADLLYGMIEKVYKS